MNIKFTQKIKLKDSLVFEELYPENLRVSLQDKKELKDDGAEFIWMIDADTKELIGETYYIPLDNMEEWDAEPEQPEDGLNPYYRKNAIYCYSNTILPKYQKQGLGRLIKAYFLGFAKAKGYDMVLGHARDNGSIQLNKSFGATVVSPWHNWYQTGETVYLYKQLL